MAPSAPPPLAARRLRCPKCQVELNPADHGNLVFDGQVWCDRCHAYDRELIRPREIQEIEAWVRLISTAFAFPPVRLETIADPAAFRLESSVLMAETDHRQRCIRFYPPGCRLATLCHELAHLYTGQDHTREWAAMFASLVAWVKSRLAAEEEIEGYKARQPISEGLPKRLY